MSEADAIRARVADHYARRVAAPEGGAEVAVSALAGYAKADVESAPEGAVSFGCGNPLAMCDVLPGDVVLDLGSGAGLDLILAARRVGAQGRAIGVDMTEAMRTRARANLDEAGVKNAELRRGTIEALPVESGSVDWVISNCVINLSPDKPRVFAEIERVLAPGGHMLISDMVVSDLPGWVRRSVSLYNACVGSALSEEEYLAGLRAAGLRDVEVAGRLIYSASQLAAIVRGELPGWLAGYRMEGWLGRLLRRFEGRVWSAQFRARKH